MPAPTAVASAIFKNKLQELCNELYFISESDYPLEPLQLELPLPATLDNAGLLNLVGQAQDKPVEVVDLAYFFRNMTADQPDADEYAKSISQRFRELQAYLQQHLQDLKVYRIGKREIAVYIIGRLDESHLAGVKTTSIET